MVDEVLLPSSTKKSMHGWMAVRISGNRPHLIDDNELDPSGVIGLKGLVHDGWMDVQ